MKRIFTLCIIVCAAMTGFAQEPADSTGKSKPAEPGDTIRIGGMIIIRKGGDKEIIRDGKNYKMPSRKKNKPENLSTNWWILDLGFANYNDETNYTNAAASGFVDPAVGKDQLKLRYGKSVNVNIWFFMQRLNMIKHVVNLKYGLGLELNNYRYKGNLRYQTNPTKLVLDNSTSYSKNKLAADYLTVPMMLNFNFTPKRSNGFGFSAGMSAGFLYSSRQKTITAADGKDKNKDDFDLNRFKLSYIAELQLGPVKLYGSMATKSMFEKGLDQTPYNIGFRFSNW